MTFVNKEIVWNEECVATSRKQKYACAENSSAMATNNGVEIKCCRASTKVLYFQWSVFWNPFMTSWQGQPRPHMLFISFYYYQMGESLYSKVPTRFLGNKRILWDFWWQIKWFLLKVNEIFKTDLLLVIGNWVVLMCGLFGISCWPLSRWDLKLTCVVVFIRAISESWKETKGNSKENNISFWETAYVQRLFQS